MRFTLVTTLLFCAAALTACSKVEDPPQKGIEPKGGILSFNDANLERCVMNARIVVGKDEKGKDITASADQDKDGRISMKESEAIETLSCAGTDDGRKIQNMRGIEVLKNLTYLNCSSNLLGHMPAFSQLQKLETLRCVQNFFTDADCVELKVLQAKHYGRDLKTLEILQQRDGRVLTCDQAQMLGHIPAQKVRDKDGKLVKSRLSDTWGFVHNGEQYATYSDNTHTTIAKIQDKEPFVEMVARLPRGKEDTFLWEDPNHSIWSEQRYYTNGEKAYLYVSTEGNWINGNEERPPVLQIFDVTDMKEIKEIKTEDLHEGLRSIHNITVDQKRGWLLAFGGTNHNAEKDEKGRKPAWKGARIYSLENPENPKYLRTVGEYYVHDGQIKTHLNERGEVTASTLYLAHGTTAIHWDAGETTNEENRLSIYDVKDINKTEIPMTHDIQYPFGYAHNIWASEDENYVIATGETSMDNQLSFWKLTKDENGFGEFEFRNGLNLQGGSVAHNAFILGNHVYVSHYSKGAQIAEIYTNEAGKKNIRLTWAYDTYPDHNTSEMNGTWGIFPFTQNEKFFFATDRDYGFYLFRKSDMFMKKERE